MKTLVLLVAATLAAAAGPQLRSATALHGHVVVAFTLGGLVAPGELRVATSPRMLPASVRLHERIAARPDANGIVRWLSRHALPPGAYYVRVSGLEESATSCLPRGQECLQEWSNVLRVVVR